MEAQCLEARDKHIFHRDDTGEVHGAAVDVDELFEQRLITEFAPASMVAAMRLSSSVAGV